MNPAAPAFAVHPHVHGEHFSAFSEIDFPIGSSPRTWGTQTRLKETVFSIRFIPTYMGNTDFSGTSVNSATVHPHVHGEHLLKAVIAPDSSGSSPRTWGTLCRVRRGGWRRRFIPTYMGNTPSNLANACSDAVHPHVHGEHLRIDIPNSLDVGSSPRTWGTLLRTSLYSTIFRFIPTYMGNTIS